jgi:hypothetical protein
MKIIKLLILICSTCYILTSTLWAQNPPILISPSGTIYDPTPEFIWHDVANVDSFNLVIDNGKQVINIVTSETTYTPLTNLAYGIYFWKVRSKDVSGNWGSFSPIWGFELIFLQMSGWVQKESIPTQISGKYIREGGALTSIGNTLYAFRGYRSNEFYKYLTNTNQWIVIESIPYGLNPGTNPPTINRKKVDDGASLCYDGNNTIYATKGGGTKEFWAYDITLNSWVQKAYVPSERGLRGGTSLAYFNGKVYLLAGEQSDETTTNFFAYNPSGDTLCGSPWTPLPNVPLITDGRTFKDGSCIVQLNSIIYALKGWGKHNYFWAYDVASNTWTQRESIPLIHPTNQTGDDIEDEIEVSSFNCSVDLLRKTKVKDGGAMTTDGNVIYAIKGGGAQDFWKYTPGTPGVWTPLDTIPRLHKKSVPKSGAALAYTNGQVWLLKGNNTPEFWCYTPEVSSKFNVQNSKLIQNVNAQSLIPNFQPQINVSPNPFTNLTIIKFPIQLKTNCDMKIYNSSGRLVKTLISGEINPGHHTLIWNGQDDSGIFHPKGIYFIRFKTDNYDATKKIALIK